LTCPDPVTLSFHGPSALFSNTQDWNLDVFKDFLSERRHGALATLHEGVPPEKVLLRILTKTARSVNLATAIAST
jgi:hypothetical protein